MPGSNSGTPVGSFVKTPWAALILYWRRLASSVKCLSQQIPGKAAFESSCWRRDSNPWPPSLCTGRDVRQQRWEAYVIFKQTQVDQVCVVLNGENDLMSSTKTSPITDWCSSESFTQFENQSSEAFEEQYFTVAHAVSRLLDTPSSLLRTQEFTRRTPSFRGVLGVENLMLGDMCVWLLLPWSWD